MALKQIKRYCVFILINLILLVACVGQDTVPDSTVPPATASATATAVPVAEATTTPDPLPQGTNGQPWWNDAVFYEVFVRSFKDSDADGTGDIQGLIDTLDYLNDGDPATTDDLGVTALWLMPVMESPSYHGYDVVDYFKVDEEYGSEEDFHSLIAEAHARGIRVIVDLVTNHTSRDHPWFAEARDRNSEKRDWYVWEDEDPGYRGPEGQQVWHRTPDGYYYALFWEGMPDLNYDNPEVTAAMQEAALFWLDDMGVDGFRLDAIKHIIENGELQENTKGTHEWLEGFYSFYKDIKPEAIAVGEAWTSTREVLNYTGDEVDIAFQFDLAQVLLNSVDSGLPALISQEQRNVVENYPPGQYATFLTNHDQNRVIDRFGGDENKAKIAATWLLTSPGVPFIYYGEEIGMKGTKPDEDIRRPMQWRSDEGLSVGFTEGRPWRNPADDYDERSVALQEEDPNSLLHHYRSLIHLRNEHDALRVGDWTAVDTSSADLYAFLRSSGDENILVIINFDEGPVENYALTLAEGPLPPAVTPEVLFGQEDPVPPAINAVGGFNDYQPFPSIPGQGSSVLKLTPAS